MSRAITTNSNTAFHTYPWTFVHLSRSPHTCILGGSKKEGGKKGITFCFSNNLTSICLLRRGSLDYSEITETWTRKYLLKILKMTRKKLGIWENMNWEVQVAYHPCSVLTSVKKMKGVGTVLEYLESKVIIHIYKIYIWMNFTKLKLLNKANKMYFTQMA